MHYYSLPGGGIHRGESVETAAVREIWEELGLVAVEVERLSECDHAGFMNDHHVCLIQANGNPHLTGHELDAFCWWDMKESIHSLPHPHVKAILYCEPFSEPGKEKARETPLEVESAPFVPHSWGMTRNAEGLRPCTPYGLSFPPPRESRRLTLLPLPEGLDVASGVAVPSQRRLLQLRTLADLHLAAVVPLLDIGCLFQELVQALPLDEAKIEDLRVVRQDIGPSAAGISLAQGKSGHSKQKSNPRLSMQA